MKVDNMKGTLIKKFDLFEKGDFKKLEFVIKVDEYNELKIQAVADKIDFLKNINEGDQVEFSYFVNGKAYNDTWFVNLTIAYIKKMEVSNTASAPSSNLVADTADDLPF